MSLCYRLFGLPCVFCDRPVDHIVVYVNAVVTVHEAPFQPACVYMRSRLPGTPAGGVVDEFPRSAASSAGCRRRVA